MSSSTKPSTTKQAVQVLSVVAGFGLVLNLMFYFLSQSYFDDRARRFGPDELLAIDSARAAFATMTGAVVVAASVAALAPRLVGHALAAAAGLAALAAAFPALSRGYPGVVGVTLIVVGVIIPLVVWRSFVRSRAAWSFLIALCATLGVITLFAAPKLRALFDVSLWTSMIVPGLFGVATVALSMLGEQYKERV